MKNYPHISLAILLALFFTTQSIAGPDSLAINPVSRDNTFVKGKVFIPLAVAVIAEAIAGITATDAFVIGGGSLLITYYVQNPAPQIHWELPVTPNEVVDIPPGPGGKKPFRPDLWPEEKLIAIVNLVNLGYQGYLKITEAAGTAASVEDQLEKLYNGNPDFQAIIDKLQQSINSGKSFSLPIATPQGVKYQIFIPLTAWGLLAFEVYDPINNGWARLTLKNNVWTWEATSLTPTLAKDLLKTFTPAPDKSPGSENWKAGLRIVGHAFERIQAGTGTTADTILVHKFILGECSGEEGCLALQTTVKSFFEELEHLDDGGEYAFDALQRQIKLLELLGTDDLIKMLMDEENPGSLIAQAIKTILLRRGILATGGAGYIPYSIFLGTGTFHIIFVGTADGGMEMFIVEDTDEGVARDVFYLIDDIMSLDRYIASVTIEIQADEYVIRSEATHISWNQPGRQDPLNGTFPTGESYETEVEYVLSKIGLHKQE